MARIDPNVIIALVTGILSLIGGVAVAVIYSKSNEKTMQMKEESQRQLTEKKDKAQTEMIVYKIDQLEKKQDKHNNMIERTIKMENAVDVGFKTVWQRYDDMKEHIEELKENLREVKK